ncbi:hypothetical protein [Streptomyces sp. NPDC051567]|uniref:hypothetical protein n=1 Tax=Streptomyces sp. NPDC051567 TaxID=3365660 RepID=UPI00378B391C
MLFLTVPFDGVGVSVPRCGDGLWLRLDERTIVEISAPAGRRLVHALADVLDLEVRPRAGVNGVIA